MRSRLKYYYEIITSLFWVIPSLMALVIISIYFIIHTNQLPWVADFILTYIPYAAKSLDGAKEILASIATSTMAVVGVLFSVTFVVLQQAANMYSPRVIENYIRSVFIQLVLGLYIGTFGFSLLQLNSINYEGSNIDKMIIGVTIAMILAFICIEMIIFYVNHIAKSIRSISILQQISLEAENTIALNADIFTSEGHTDSDRVISSLQVKNYICASSRGYLQRIDFENLKKVIDKCQVDQCRLLVKPGDYIQKGSDLVELTNFLNGEKVKAKIQDTLKIGPERTRFQDISFSVRQMVDIALRALSPGINDPNTAVEAIHVIGSALLKFTKTELGNGKLYYRGDNQILVCGPNYQNFLHLCYDEILRAGEEFPVVLETIMQILELCIIQTENTNFKKLQLQMYYRVKNLLKENDHELLPMVHK